MASKAKRGTSKAKRATGEAKRGTGEAKRGTGNAKRATGNAKRGTGRAKRGAKDKEGKRAKEGGPKLRKVGKATLLDESKLKKALKPRLTVAFTHDAREHIFVVLNEEISSPTAVGKGLGVTSTYLNYHFELLEENDLIELVDKRKVRGVWENFYRAKETLYFDRGDWECLPATFKSGQWASTLQLIYDEAAQALRAGTAAARSDVHTSWITMPVDEKGFSDLDALLLETLERVQTIKAESAERLAAAEGRGIHATVALLSFEVPDNCAPQRKDPATS